MTTVESIIYKNTFSFHFIRLETSCWDINSIRKVLTAVTEWENQWLFGSLTHCSYTVVVFCQGKQGSSACPVRSKNSPCPITRGWSLSNWEASWGFWLFVYTREASTGIMLPVVQFYGLSCLHNVALLLLLKDHFKKKKKNGTLEICTASLCCLVKHIITAL